MSEIKKTFQEAYENSNAEEVREQKKKARQEQDEKQNEEQKEIDLEKASPYMLMKLGLEKLVEKEKTDSLDD